MMTLDELAQAFERLANRYRNIASAFRITGRFNHAATAEARANAFADAASLTRDARDLDWPAIDAMFRDDDEGRKEP